MNLHEYQAKSLLALYGVPVPKGTIADSVDSACGAAQQLGGQCVVKAQIKRSAALSLEKQKCGHLRNA